MSKRNVLVICMVLALTFCMCQCVFADGLDTTDAATLGGYGIVTDDFEHTNVTEETQVKGYPTYSNRPSGTDSFVSDVLLGDATANNSNMYLVPGEGRDNSIGLRLESSNNVYGWFKTRSIKDFYDNGSLVSDKTAVFTYDLRIGANPSDSYDNTKCFKICFYHVNLEDDKIFNLKKDDENKFYFETYDGLGKFYYETDKWYTVELAQTATKRTGAIIDEDGNVCLSVSKNLAPYTDKTKQYFTMLAFQNGADSSNSIRAYVDNLKINVYNAQTPPQFTKASIESDATDISRNKPVTLNFTQEMNSATISIKDENGDAFTGFRVEPCGILGKKIVFTKLLDKNTEYTIELTSAKNMSGVTFSGEDFSFTTCSPYILQAEYIGKELSGDKKQLTATYKLMDSESIETMSCRVMGILYDGGKMVDADIVALTNATVGANLTATFSFDQAISDTSSVTITMLEENAWLPLNAAINCD